MFKKEGNWTRGQTLLLISEYKKKEVLYKKNHPLHQKMFIRKKALEEIVLSLKETKPNVNIFDVKNKIKILQQQMAQEKKKMQAYECSTMPDNAGYIPTLWCFDELSFLLDASEEFRGDSSMECDCSGTGITINEEDSANKSVEPAHDYSFGTTEPNEFESSEQFQCKRIKIEEEVSANKSIELVNFSNLSVTEPSEIQSSEQCMGIKIKEEDSANKSIELMDFSPFCVTEPCDVESSELCKRIKIEEDHSAKKSRKLLGSPLCVNEPCEFDSSEQCRSIKIEEENAANKSIELVESPSSMVDLCEDEFSNEHLKIDEVSDLRQSANKSIEPVDTFSEVGSSKKRSKIEEEVSALRQTANNSIDLVSSLLTTKNVESREELFCKMLCSELKQLQFDETYDNVTAEIFSIVRKSKRQEREQLAMLSNESMSTTPRY